MSKLAEFAMRISERRPTLDIPSTVAVDSSADADSSTLNLTSESVYGNQSYWDQRYQDGVIGASEKKGEFSNEWWIFVILYQYVQL